MEKMQKCPKWIIILTLNKPNKEYISLNTILSYFAIHSLFSIVFATAMKYVK